MRDAQDRGFRACRAPLDSRRSCSCRKLVMKPPSCPTCPPARWFPSCAGAGRDSFASERRNWHYVAGLAADRSKSHLFPTDQELPLFAARAASVRRSCDVERRDRSTTTRVKSASAMAW